MRTAAAALALLAAPWTAAAQPAAVSLPDESQVESHKLVLNGVGVRETSVLKSDVYVAGLYVESRTTDPESILAPGAVKQLMMRFARSVAKEDLAAAWTEGFQKNAKDQAAVAAGLRSLNATMTDVKSGDMITLTYEPATGTTVRVKGRDATTIAGSDFQRVLFSIWLGSQPPSIPLREALLGRSRKR